MSAPTSDSPFVSASLSDPGSNSGPPSPSPAPVPDLPRGLPRRLAALAALVAAGVRDAPWPCAAWGATALLQGLLVPAQLGLTKLLVDALAAAVRGSLAGGRGPAAAPHHALLWLGLLAASLLADRCLGGMQAHARAAARERQGPAAQERVMRDAASLELAVFEHSAYYDRIHRVLSETEGRVPAALAAVLGLLRTVPSFAGYVAALALLSPLLLAVTLTATVPTVLAWALLGDRAWGIRKSFTRNRRLAEYYAGMLTGRPFAQEVRLYGLAETALARWSGHFWRGRNGERRQALRDGTPLRAAGTASIAVAMAALWFVATHGLHHASAGTYAVLFQAVEGLFGGCFQLSSALFAVGEHAGFAAEYATFGRTVGKRAGGPAPPPAGARPGSPAMDASPVPAAGRIRTAPPTLPLRLDRVWFRYPGSTAAAVAGVTLDIAPGEKVALVGENGAGKTTLTKLILGLYRPDSGCVTLGGRDVREAGAGRLSAVFQDFVRYQLTLAENVGLSDPESLGDRARVEDALARARALGLARDLPGGCDALLGPDVGGTDLSGGQWQRVALARGLYSDPAVLVLDEPTAALDPLAEVDIFRQFAELAAGRTAVLVSHRLGICRLADRVVVLAGGRVAEEGPHRDLADAGGLYARMFEAQARWYA